MIINISFILFFIYLLEETQLLQNFSQVHSFFFFQPNNNSRLTQEEVETFCLEWGIGLRFKPVALGCDVSIDQCPPGSIALYCRHFEFSNPRHPFSNFVLNILEY
ncbi:hypothetical protein Hanom_Chr16g01463171 [Helianthus anomalus]